MKQYTREEVESEFKVERETIVSPGKYEGAPRFTPYFDAKTEARHKSVHTIREEDRREFPELKPYKTVVVSRESNGRVCAQAFVSPDYW